MRTLGVALLSIVPALAAGQEFPALQGSHRVLVTVDDLPIAAGRLHPARADGSTSGHTLMVLHRSGNAWRIVHDASM